MATTKHRQAACTHSNVTRLFDPLDSHKCQMCGRASSFGWLYCCTQDFNSFLPGLDFSSAQPEELNSVLNEQVANGQLSQSVLRGIEGGQYTAQQVRQIRAQKRRVQECIAMQEEKLDSSSDSSLSSSSLSTSDSIHNKSTLTDIPVALLQEHSKICRQTGMESAVIQESPRSLMSSAFTKTYIEPLVPLCHFKCCHNCRPALRDPAFQSLNAILSEPLKHPPQWEYDNRRISDAAVLKKISSSQPQPLLRRTDQIFDDLKDITGSQACGTSENGDTNSGIDNTRSNVRRRSGFRNAVRKALAAMDHSKHVASSSKRSSRSSSRESLVQMSRSMLFKRRGKKAEKENRFVSNRALQESLVLMLAVNTPLPCASQDFDSLDGGEVKVGAGVAVTEEGVETQSPDIIMISKHSERSNRDGRY